MRTLVPGLVLAAALVGCGGGSNARRLPPETLIEDHPAAITNQAHARISFVGGGVVTGFTCQLDGGAPVACGSPFEADVADGDHAFQVHAANGDTLDETPAIVTWRVDTVAPDTALVTAPPALDNTRAPTFAFTGHDDAGPVRFECAVDDAAFAACSSPSTAQLADGDHRYGVRAIDLAGNVDPTPALVAWRLDTTAPDTAITSGPAAGAITGAAASFAFSSPDGAASFECALDGGGFTACSSPRALTLAGGDHTFAVRARDPAGLVDPSPARRAWTVDLTPPAVAISAGPANPSRFATATFAFASPDPTAGFTCQVDGAPLAPCATGFTTAALGDGGHTFTVRAADPVGNASTAALAWVIDRVAPVVAVAPVASPTRAPAPAVSFTVTGGATAIECQVDGGGFAACSSPFTPPALTDGSHAVAVRARDAAGNLGTGATSFVIDTVAPTLVFDDAPPAQWPVNYFDLRFHSGDASAALACSLDGAAFAACASPLAVTVGYDRAASLAVRATDPAGNAATISTTWTPRSGLVLHYPWEQGATHNTSLLAQRPPYSPDATATLPVVGGWAGSAAGSPAGHAYPGTRRALSSSATGGYTASVWVRVHPSAPGGTIWSTLASAGGVALRVAGSQATLQVNDRGTPVSVTAAVPLDQWVQLGVRAAGPGAGVQLLVNGVVAGTAAAPTATGFGAGQAPDLTVGPVAGVDLDDLRLYNRALAGAELCTILVRGQLDAAGACVPLTPGLELSFEGNQVRDTGRWNLPLGAPQAASFVATKLGAGLRLPTGGQPFSYLQGFASNVAQAPGHTLALWFVAGVASDTLVDFLHPCVPGAGFTCGVRVTYSVGGGVTVIANGGSATPVAATIPVGNGAHSLVIAERKASDGVTTQALRIYVDGALTPLAIGAGNVYGSPSDTVQLPRALGSQLDELELWPRDLSLDPELLCENGWDGEWSPASATCLLTSN